MYFDGKCLMDIPQHTNLEDSFSGRESMLSCIVRSNGIRRPAKGEGIGRMFGERGIGLEKVTKKKRIDPLKAELANSGEEDSKQKRKTRQTERKCENTSASFL